MSETDMNNVMNRLEARLDAMEKGELPPALAASIEDSEDKDEKKNPFGNKDEKKDSKKDDDEKGDEEEMEKSGDNREISSEYLSWMEGTLKSAGVDTNAAELHFDQMNKAQLGGFDNPDAVDGADYFGGQVRGRGQDKGSPSTNAVSALSASGGKTPSGALGPAQLSKSINPANLTSADIEAAFGVYKASASRQEFFGNLENSFQNRLVKENTIAKHRADKSNFDARTPIAEVLKSIESLTERIDNISTESVTFAKSAGTSTVEVPSTQDLSNMSWDEVHSLATKAVRGA